MVLSPEVLTTIGLAFLGSVVWAIRIEGRVKNHETLFTEREKYVEASNTDLTSRLSRIEDKVDALISRELGERHGSIKSHSGRV
jgi:hypothetical protein